MEKSFEPDDITKIFRQESSSVHLSKIDLSATADLFKVCQYIRDLSDGKNHFYISVCKLDGSKCTHLFEALSTLRTEFSLDISYNNLGPDGVSGISQILAASVRLNKLTLDGTNLGDNGVVKFLLGVPDSRTLCSLDLANNRIGKDGVICLASIIPKLDKLASLNLSGNDMSDEQAVLKMCSAVKTSQIKELNISLCKITPAGAAHLSTLINTNRVLEILNVSCNHLGDDPMAEIGRSLVDNVVLKGLNLSGTRIGPVGAARLAKCLELNDTLRDLDLSRVHQSHIAIGVDGALKIADMLTLNRGICTLNLYWQCIGNSGAAAIANAMESNRTMARINLGGNYISSEGVRRLEGVMGISDQLRTSRPISSWKDSCPMTPLLINRPRRTRPSTVGPTGRRSMMGGRPSMVSTNSMPFLPPCRRQSQSPTAPRPSSRFTILASGNAKPSLQRSNTTGLVSSPSNVCNAAAFFDFKFDGNKSSSESSSQGGSKDDSRLSPKSRPPLAAIGDAASAQSSNDSRLFAPNVRAGKSVDEEEVESGEAV